MKRKKIRNKRLDKKIFRRTAQRTRAINVEPSVARGGTRLWNI